jgi:hypothetical protein
MGGFGSGPRRFFTKRTADSCQSISVKDLKRMGLLKPGTDTSGIFRCCFIQEPPLYLSLQGLTREDLSIPVEYSINIGEKSGTLRLTYMYPATGQEYDCTIHLVTTPCQFGGVRWWLKCPVSFLFPCSHRVGVLYLCNGLFFGGQFGCRHCHRLTYESTQKWDRRVNAVLQEVMALAMSLSHKPGFLDGIREKQSDSEANGTDSKSDQLSEDYLADLASRMKLLDSPREGLALAGYDQLPKNSLASLAFQLKCLAAQRRRLTRVVQRLAD